LHSGRSANRHSSYIAARPGRRPAQQLDLLIANLPSIADALESGAVIVFEEARIRVRPLPISGD